ncbi:hypothetical protein IW262DRAFT_275505 [Armillaria fumosa]|nr:hypothetical protein IW262DRAFT_275505 [Armillaria fumosa]
MGPSVTCIFILNSMNPEPRLSVITGFATERTTIIISVWRQSSHFIKGGWKHSFNWYPQDRSVLPVPKELNKLGAALLKLLICTFTSEASPQPIYRTQRSKFTRSKFFRLFGNFKPGNTFFSHCSYRHRPFSVTTKIFEAIFIQGSLSSGSRLSLACSSRSNKSGVQRATPIPLSDTQGRVRRPSSELFSVGPLRLEYQGRREILSVSIDHISQSRNTGPCRRGSRRDLELSLVILGIFGRVIGGDPTQPKMHHFSYLSGPHCGICCILYLKGA